MKFGKQDSYFSKFPFNEYKGKIAIDIMKRVKFSDNVKNYLSVFYTHNLSRDENVDSLAFNYYDDVNFDWLIYLANDVIDPHFDVPLSDQDFERYIVKKYGSKRTAVRKIIHYENNYQSDDTILSSNEYEALAPTFNANATEDPDSVGNPKKYWVPIINITGILGYERAQENIIYNTNKIMSFSFDTAMSTAFTVGDIVEKDNLTYGEVVFANTSVCNIKNIYGDFTSDSNYTITDDAGLSGTVNAASVSTDRQVIPSVELVYHKAVSYYDYEEKLNDLKREIFLVDKENRKSLSTQLNDVLR